MVNRYRTGGDGVGQSVPNAVKFKNGLTYDECIVMILQLTKSTIRRVGRHEGADRPLIDGASASVPLEQCGRDKRL